MGIDIKEFPNIEREDWVPKSVEEIIIKALGIVNFEPIMKTATGRNWEYDKKEVYLDDNGEVLLGYLVYDEVELEEKGLDGSIEVYKQFFISMEGELMIFYSLIESHYVAGYGTECRNTRIATIDESLTLNETDEFVWNLLYEINENL